MTKNLRTGKKLWSRRAVFVRASMLSLLGLTGRAFADYSEGPFAMRVIQSGHSLTDPIVPMLNAILAAEGVPQIKPYQIERSTIPGSPMEWRWNNRVEPGPDARHDIAAYDVLVLTERVSLVNTMPWHDSKSMALRWFENSWAHGKGGKGAQTVLYASWVEVDSGPQNANPHNDPEAHLPFRDRLPLEMARWQSIADHVNVRRPYGSPAMRVIPGPLVMAAAHDAIAAGEAPGISTIEDLFEDNIHVNDTGAYLIALAHFAVLYNVDPRTLSAGSNGLGSRQPETAAWMKQLIHEVLLAYPAAHYSGRV
ncbi:hypothetical protein [Paracoccus benzoatiresistens]|uniref:Uncharacterized protein n=1 Tax=Paracoccus benzoatiresistens TaxID=2997341 RepID=A0ABT4JC35_9RHOB|nr:hypothetical protein [Paracoccus sp. EF6]MCZ0964479.1 hypothetical protein [Paracoccus sp. EF6]